MGQGAVNALQDAVVLANCLYDMESTHPKDIAKTFDTYKSLRGEDGGQEVQLFNMSQ
jgi:2-polyprenyl-6-methoxyphenol hydroxylase-like FAD-dependent oxidoreductase